MSEVDYPGRILGLDVGTKRIGFAVSDECRLFARPLSVWTRQSLDQDFAHFSDLLDEYEVKSVVVGVPYRLDGSKSRTTELVLEFIKVLRQKFPALPVTERDEALTTWEAEAQLKARGVLPLDRKGLVDAFAAAVILQEELDAFADRN